MLLRRGFTLLKRGRFTFMKILSSYYWGSQAFEKGVHIVWKTGFTFMKIIL